MSSQAITRNLIIKNVIPKYTSSLSNPDFLLVLIESLNLHLLYPIEYTNDPTHDTHHLISQLELLTRESFLEVYHYSFHKYPSPRRLSKPSEPFAFSEFISCPTSCPQLIEAHINTRGINANQIPRAYTKKIAFDLFKNLTKCLNAQPFHGWEIEFYHDVYGENHGILSNWAIDLVWVWQIVTAVDWNKSKPMQRNYLLLCYAGVAYETKEMPRLHS